MATQTIRYMQSINGDFAVVPVIFIKPNPLKVRSLIDTGAAYSVFKSWVGEKLGINIYDGKPRPLTVGNGEKMRQGQMCGNPSNFGLIFITRMF